MTPLTLPPRTHNAARLMSTLAPLRPHSALLAPEKACDGSQVDVLIDRAFGPGRFVKAAERLREGAQPLLDLSFVAWRGAVAVGCVRLWSVRVGGRPALLLGPIAVDAAHRRSGLGADLVRKALDAAKTAGWALILLVGDAPFFGPLGFSAAPATRIVMPGPVDQRRVMVCALVPGAAEDLGGLVTRAA